MNCADLKKKSRVRRAQVISASAAMLFLGLPPSQSIASNSAPLAEASTPTSNSVSWHRLNRTEYGNAVRDLFGFPVDATSLLPPDNAAFGFDNIAGQLAMNPTLLERYISAAKKISAQAVGDPSDGRLIENFKQNSELSQTDRMGPDFPIGTRGGIRIKKTFAIPGDYVLRFRFHNGNAPEPLLVLLDGKIIAPNLMTPVPPAAAYGTLDPWGTTEVPFKVSAGEHEIVLTFVKKTAATADVGFDVPFSVTPFTQIRIADVDVDGPVKVAAQQPATGNPNIFICTPRAKADEEACARKILARLARRAYRGKVAAGDVEGLLGFYRTRSAAEGFRSGIRFAIERMLVDPRFLFRIERQPASDAPLDQMALASRLSFFLWSSIPDDELLSLAEKKQLTGRTLDRQVSRMMADKRAIESLVGNFAWQWLELRRLQEARPITAIFSEFNATVRQAVVEETRLFLTDQIMRNRPISELLTANYTFMNEPLAKYIYNAPGVYGSHFRRVEYPDARRSGLLGHASILTLTSYGNRTTPVIRGKWVMESILGQSVPPPPPNVPGINETQAGSTSLTMREVMEEHRTSPACSACHKLMDPIGFAMENFNGVGIWRTHERNALIDANVQIGGKEVKGITGLNQYLVDRTPQLVNNVAHKAMIFALGRELTARETASVERFTEKDPRGVTWGDIIKMVVNSRSFKGGRQL